MVTFKMDGMGMGPILWVLGIHVGCSLIVVVLEGLFL